LPRKLLLGLSFLVHCCNDDCFLLWSLLSDWPKNQVHCVPRLCIHLLPCDFVCRSTTSTLHWSSERYRNQIAETSDKGDDIEVCDELKMCLSCSNNNSDLSGIYYVWSSILICIMFKLTYLYNVWNSIFICMMFSQCLKLIN
jgi:hypothetical protein